MTSQAVSRIDFLSPVSAIPKFGPKRVAALHLSHIHTLGDLLYYFPRGYSDRSTIIPINELSRYPDQECNCIARVTRTRVERGRKSRLRIQLDDESGTMEALWFQGVQYFRSYLKTGMRLLVTGKVSIYGHKVQMVHPQVETIPASLDAPKISVLPVYRITVAMKEAMISRKVLTDGVWWALNHVKHFPQKLPARIEEEKQFPPLDECLQNIHFPGALEQVESYKERIVYENLYTMAITLRLSKKDFSQRGRVAVPGNLYERFYESLPFTLTKGQEQAVSALVTDCGTDLRMHRLLQGDVGSGKTIVAFFAALSHLDAGHQVAWLAPTEVLAFQTWMTLNHWLEPLGLNPVLLKGAMSKADKREIVTGLKTGDIAVVVGTHALLSPDVTFKKLGIAIVDEQHKFGVEQRKTIHQKDSFSDFLLISATPIPGSLAATLYGDLDLVTVKGLPGGRKPISTHIVPHAKRGDMEVFISREIREKGGSAYIIVPRIGFGDDEEEELKDVYHTFKQLTTGPFRGIPACFLHGKLKASEKEDIVRGFSGGKIKILVSTTVVEVGIDCRDATVIVVENAERFGLAQLHQLRGRVGRGDKKSWCFLLKEPTSNDSADERLKTFCAHHDGFKIAEMDLKQRGPGQVSGVKQSGWDDDRLLMIMKNLDLFRDIQKQVHTLFDQ